METNQSSENKMLEQYKIHIDLYKHYLKLSIEFNIFYYAITGAILSFYFVHYGDNNIIKYSLIFPIIMGLMFGVFFFWSSSKVKYSRKEIISLCSTLGFETIPEINVLNIILKLFGSLLFFVGLFLILLLFFNANKC